MSELHRMRESLMRMRPRARGVLLLLVGLGTGVIFIVVPITSAQAGKPYRWLPILALLATIYLLDGLLSVDDRGAVFASG